MIETGKITNVWIANLGSELVSDAAAAQALLVVDDAYDFNETGGTLRLTDDTNTIDLPYTSVNMDTDTITLTAPLAGTWLAGTDVAVLPLGRQKKAQIDLNDGDEGPVAIVPMTFDTMLDDGIREPDEQEAVLIDDSSGRWEISAVDDQQGMVNGSSVTGDGLPQFVPVDPPPISPALKVTGTTNSLVIEALDEVAAGTLINYYVSTVSGFVPDPTTLVSTTPAQVAVISADATGAPLQPDTTYYVVAVATNIIGSALPSAEVQGLLNLDNVDALIAARLVVGFILTGSIAVGNMTIDAITGITINAAGGGTILHFPVDGVSPLELTANVVAQSLNVQDNLTIAGGGTIYGNLQMANGIQDPLTAPGLSSYYPSVNTGLYTDGSDRAYYFADMVEYPADTTKVAVGMSDSAVTGGAGTAIWVFDKITGAFTSSPTGGGNAWQKNFYAWGGMTYYNGSYYFMGQDYDRAADWYLYRISATTWALQTELRIGGSGAFNGYNPRIAADVTNARIAMVWIPNSLDLTLRWLNPTTLATVGADNVLYANCGHSSIGAVHIGDPGIGSQKVLVALKDLSGSPFTKVLCWNLATAPTRDATHDFARANGNKIEAMTYDVPAGVMLTIDIAGRLNHYGTGIVDTTHTAEHAWYDADVTGGTHETHVGPSKSYVLPARAYLSVSVPPPPDFTNPDTSNHDRANQVKLYMSNNGGTTWHYQIFTTTPWSATMLSVNGLPTDTPNAGAAFPVALTPAVLRSGAIRLDGKPKSYIDGSGIANLDGLIPPGAMMMWPGTTAPTGWLICNGQAVSRATYADLKAAVFDGTNHRFGNGDGTTTFNVPDFRGRFPAGVSPSGSTLVTPGSFETASVGGTAPGAADEARFNHRHTHDLSITINTLSANTQTNTTTGGTATRVTGLAGDTPGNHRHVGSTALSEGVGGAGANLQNHGMLGINFIIKT
jgi:microcystin-dependent protein